MLLGLDGKLAGFVAVADPIKPSAPEAIERLHRLGLDIVMATGDNPTTAKAVAGKLGIDEVRAGLRPEQKLDLIDELQRKGRVVAMAGDGVNDSPALAKADVGIAMGTGADVAMESAGLTLLKGDLRGVVRGVNLYKIEPGPRLIGRWASMPGPGRLQDEILTYLKPLDPEED